MFELVGARDVIELTRRKLLFELGIVGGRVEFIRRIFVAFGSGADDDGFRIVDVVTPVVELIRRNAAALGTEGDGNGVSADDCSVDIDIGIIPLCFLCCL